jgi:transglycosylase-like protein with SLT domain
MSSAYKNSAHSAATNRRHEKLSHDDQARERGQQGAGSHLTGACKARVKIGKRLTIACAFLCSTAPVELLASTDSPSPAKTSFAYSLSHPVKPLPDSVIQKITEPAGDALSADDFDFTDSAPKTKPVDVRVGPPRHPSRDLVCSAAASVAQANNLPVHFFANLIWSESSFDIRTISRAGAQGIAQFMPRTAVQFGLINPFEPIHALNVSGKFLRDLNAQFGNLGLAAAAYNAGPRRVSDWLAKRGDLPTETRNYVVRITGRPVEEWVNAKNDVEMLVMPAKAPCVQVAEAVEAQAKAVRTARLIAELAATASQTRDKKDDDVQPAAVAASDTTERGWIVRATVMVRNVLRRIEAREAAAKLAAKEAAARLAARAEAKAAAAEAKAAAKAAKLALNDQDNRPSGRTARAFEAKVFTPPPAKAPSSVERDPPRSAVRTIGATDGKDLTRGGPKTDGSKSNSDKLEPARQVAFDTHPHPVRPDMAKPDMAKIDVATADVAKPEDARSEQKEAANHPPRRSRVQRVARFSYSDMLRPQ